MARNVGSWLSGPQSESSEAIGYPGQRLGLPQDGPGSIARFGRRILALLIDWLVGYGLVGLAVAGGLLPISQLATAVLVVWLALGVVALRLFSFTPGQWVAGLRVVSIDQSVHPGVGVGRALVRGVLISLLIPPLFTDEDLRGLQDLASKTAVIRR